MPPANAIPHSQPPHEGAGIALALSTEGGAPEWIQLMPSGPVVAGRDGRQWKMSDAAAVIAATNLPFALDYEHAQDLKAVNGEEAPAAAWIDKLEIRNGEVWGHASWTERAARSVASREYRFVSPTFVYGVNSEVLRLVGGGLVNRPNFSMTALNREEKLC